jgi:hypothetical protein
VSKLNASKVVLLHIFRVAKGRRLNHCRALNAELELQSWYDKEYFEILMIDLVYLSDGDSCTSTQPYVRGLFSS